MRLISCHIRAFGRFNDYKHDFSEGYEPILEENGWGKTTFCVFIKSMLYGLEYNLKRSLNERKHYKPWDGGDYGGSLTFEADGVSYRIERSFGDKDKDDTFALYNADTGLPSEDYSQAVGEELFGVDRESFEKSIFIPQAAIETAMTDSLNAKMGNLSTVQDDINRFDEAIERVGDKLRTYTSRGSKNPGSITQLKDRIRENRAQLERLPSLRGAYEATGELLTGKRAEYHHLTFARDELKAAIVAQSKREQELGAYREKKQTLERELAEAGKLDDFFANGVPESAELERMEETARAIKLGEERAIELRRRLPRESEIERLTALFNGHEVSDEELAGWQADAARIRELQAFCELHRMPPQDRDTLKSLRSYFSEREPSDAELDAASDGATRLIQLDGQIETLEIKHRDAETRQSEARGSRHIFTVRGLLVLFAAVLLIIGGAVNELLLGHDGVGLYYTLGLTGLGIVMLLIVFALALRNRREIRDERRRLADEVRAAEEELSEKRAERQQVADGVLSFLRGYLVTPTDSYAQMVSEIRAKSELYHRLREAEEHYLDETRQSTEELSDRSVKFHTSLAYFVDAYGNYRYEEVDETEVLVRLSADVGAYREVTDTLKRIEAQESELDGLREELGEFLGKFPENAAEAAQADEETVAVSVTAEPLSTEDKLSRIRKNTDRYAQITERVAGLRAELSEFEARNDINDGAESVEQMQVRQQELEDRLTELRELITKETERQATLSDEIEELLELSESIEDIEAEQRRLEKEAELLERTEGYLRQARERFLSRYMGPLRRGLQKYLKMILPEERAAEFELDMNLDVRLTRRGSTWEREYLSAGYRDLVSLCARMALIDVLYTREKPPVILDDPFTNLDTEKTARALDLVRRLAEDRQIIYLTCSESRV